MTLSYVYFSFSVKMKSVLGLSGAQDEGPTSSSVLFLQSPERAGVTRDRDTHMEYSSRGVNPTHHRSYPCAGRVFLAKEKEKCPGLTGEE